MTLEFRVGGMNRGANPGARFKSKARATINDGEQKLSKERDKD
jgi:hypothetical protein